jgi:acetyltransferase-like isoleucine patch superfamily enzyme
MAPDLHPQKTSSTLSRHGAGWMVNLACVSMMALIYGLPLLLVASLISLQIGFARSLLIILSPIVYATGFILVAGGLSLPFHRFIVAGKFPRDITHPVYRGRKLYGLCWTALFYCKPVYWFCLSVPWLRWISFRLFGYKGQMDFTLYPDTWIRDLPLLDFGQGVYVANRATLGTNMPLRNGRILVDGIRLDEGVLIGHLTMVGPGVIIGKGSEISSGTIIGTRTKIGTQSRIEPFCAVGLRVRVGNNVSIGGACLVYHYAEIGDDSVVGAGAQIGFKTKVPNLANIPPHGVLFDTRKNANFGSCDTLNEEADD